MDTFVKNKTFLIVVSVIVVLIIISAIVVPIVLLESATIVPPNPSVTVTVSFSPIPDPRNVTITTTIAGVIGCLAFSDPPSVLRFGNCGDPNITSQWGYDDVFQVLTNTLLRTGKSNCMIYPSSIVNPTVTGQPTIATFKNCYGLEIQNDKISAGSNYLGVIANKLVWVGDESFAQPFTINYQ